MSKSQLHPLGYESKIAHLSTGHYYRYADIHPPENVKTIATALLLHGFPDSAAAHNESASYGWRHQIKGWTSRGIRLIIPDTLGYYGSSQPSSPEDYSTKRQSDDLEELVRYAGVPKEDKIIIISHDWGSVTAGRLIQFKPDLVKAAAVFCVPFFPPSPQYIPLEKFSEQFPNMEYQVFLASPESTAILDANAERFIRLTYTSAWQRDAGEVPSLERAGVIEGWLKDESKDVVPELLSQEVRPYHLFFSHRELAHVKCSQELTTILSEIKAGKGFGAMLNYYRVGQINYEAEKGLPHDVRPDLPKLIVTPSADPFLPPAVTQYAQTLLKNVDVVWLDGLCGHWVQLEKPQEIEKIVGEWVEKIIAHS
ncbi:Ndr family [Rhizoctonia solani]|uniref:Ndr family n=1 Tax=Rhizoctonia solani TaxID=456999 RepID=A0A8H7HHF5_9AGAM|nr:Ndr family [Rhizoctonia solani]